MYSIFQVLDIMTLQVSSKILTNSVADLNKIGSSIVDLNELRAMNKRKRMNFETEKSG